MTKKMQLDLPDEVYDALAELAQGSGQWAVGSRQFVGSEEYRRRIYPTLAQHEKTIRSGS